MPVVKNGRAVSLAGAAVVVLAVAAFRLLPPTYSTGDRAFLELYTAQATRGNLMVGPYSRFGWNHPGPAYLYALAPLYALSGQREHSLDATALLINTGAIAALIVVVSRYGDPYLGWSLVGAVAIFLFRPGPVRNVGEVLTSPWNPHGVILPFSLLIGLCAALAVGRTWVLPSIALVASLIVQTHVGLLPCAAALIATAVTLRLTARDARDASLRPVILWSATVLALLWMPAVVDQVIGSRNASEIANFFLSADRPRPSLSAAFSAVAYGLSAAIRPLENLAVGNVIISAADLGPFPALWLVLQVILLALVWRWALRQNRPFHAALCLLCLVATAVASWSAVNVRGMLRDYLVFWMSAVGMTNVMVIGGAGVCWAAGILRRRGIEIPARMGSVTVAAFLLLVFLFGATGLARDYQRTLIGEGRFPNRREGVRLLFRDVQDRMRVQGYRNPRVRLAPRVRVVAAGVVLQLYKADVPVAVADPWVPVFTEALRSTGAEDVTFRFVGRALDQELRDRSDYLLVGTYRDVSVYEQLR